MKKRRIRQRWCVPSRFRVGAIVVLKPHVARSFRVKDPVCTVVKSTRDQFVVGTSDGFWYVGYDQVIVPNKLERDILEYVWRSQKEMEPPAPIPQLAPVYFYPGPIWGVVP